MWLWAGEGSLSSRAVALHPASPTDTAGKRARGFRLLPLLSFLTLSSLGTLQVGEDVPDARKCACASHVAKVAEFFQVRVGPGLS